MDATTISKEGVTTVVQQAEDTVPVDKREAEAMATFELGQVLNLLTQLSGDDWSQQTECTEWTVQDMTAHLAGGCAGWANLKDFVRQLVFNPYMKEVDVPVDAINRREIEDRTNKTPEQLVDELRKVGPKAIRNRKRLPGLLRRIQISAKPMPGKMSMAYLADVVYPRDQWMHRMDLCRATGKAWVSNPAHDRRLMDLIVLDMTKHMNRRYSVMLNVTITDNQVISYRFGNGELQATIDIDLITINRRSSDRIKTDETLKLAEVRGDKAVAQDFLRDCEVLY